MNDELIKDKLDTHERRLNDHSVRLDRLEQRGAAVDEKIENLCAQIKNLVTTMRWFIGLIVGAFVSFFFYAIQNNLFK
jgi:hypothetical protein